MDIDIFRILHKDCCEAKLRSRKKDDVLHELTKIALRSPALQGISEQEIYDKLKAREEQGSTGIGGGLAIPHTSIPQLNDFVLALAVSKRGVNFEALDKHKVNFFALILGPENQPKLHIQLLAQLSHILRDEKVRRELVNSRTPLALYENFMSQCQPVCAAEDKESARQKIVILILQKGGLFEDIIEYLTELGISGAAVIESKGVRNILTGMPLFADFIKVFGERSDETRTIIFTIHENLFDDVVSGIEDITGDLSTHAGAMIMAIDPVFVKGTLELV